MLRSLTNPAHRACTRAAALLFGIWLTSSPANAQVVTDEAGLRTAILNANAAGSGTITLGATIVLTGSLPPIQGAINFVGTGAPNFAIDANLTGRVFTIVEGAVTITNLRILNARAIGGAGGAGGFPGGGGGGIGAAIFVATGSSLTTTNLEIQNAAAVGGAGGARTPGLGGGGGGGLGGAGGATQGLGGGGGGGFAAVGGVGGVGGGGGGGGGLSAGATGGAGAVGGGGGGGRSFGGGAGADGGPGIGGGGEGGGLAAAGAAAIGGAGGAGSSGEGGDGGSTLVAGQPGADDGGGGGGGADAVGGAGARRSGGGGGGADVGVANVDPLLTAGGDSGAASGGGGAGSNGVGGGGSEDGGGGGGGVTGGESALFGGGGGGTVTGANAVFGGAGAGGTTPGLGPFGGPGNGSTDGAGGGSAAGGAIFVEEGGTLTMNSPSFVGPFTVTPGAPTLGSAAQPGVAVGAIVFSQGGTGRLPLVIDVPAATTLTFALPDSLAGGGRYRKTGTGTLTLSAANLNAIGQFQVAAGTLALGLDAPFGGEAFIEGDGGALASAGGARVLPTPVSLLAGGLTVTGADNITLNGPITSPVGVVGGLTAALTAPGILTLAGTNTFPGPVNVVSGTLVASNGFAIGDLAPVVVNAGTFTVASPETIGSLAGLATGPVTLNAALTVGGNNTSTVYAGPITGAGALTKVGTGVFSLTGTSPAFTGGINIFGGAVAVASTAGLGTGPITLNGGGLQTDAPLVLPNPIVLGAAGGGIGTLANATVSGIISGAPGTGPLYKAGAGTLTLTGNNTYTGGTVVVGGLLAVAGAGPLGTGPLNLAGGGLQAAANATLAVPITLGGAGTIDTQTFALTVNGPITGAGSLTKTGTGTLTLSGANTFTGGTSATAGALTLLGGAAIADTSPISVTAGATLNVNASETIGSINSGGFVVVNPGVTLTISGAGDSLVAGAISGAGGLAKAGAGTLTLAGANTYTGPTSLSAGTLLIPAGGSIVSATSVTGGTLTGAGAVAGVTMTGGTIRPSSILTVNGNLTIGPGSSLTTVINGLSPSTGFGQVSVNGTVTLGGTLSASLGGGFTPSQGNSFIIITNDGADPVLGTFAGLAQGATVTLGGANLRITYTGGDGNDVVLEVLLLNTYLAEGATNAFFDVRIALVNPSATETANVTMRFLKSTGEIVVHTLTIPVMGRRTVNPETEVPGMADANFSTVIESNVRVVVDRTMSWDASGYGSHAETSSSAPATTWYFAEGATHGQFTLFYLLQNATSTDAEVVITYLRPAGAAPIEQPVTVGANSRMTIQVDEVPGLAETDVSAIIRVTNGVPISTERAMYVSTPEQPFAAGTDVAGIAAPSTTWFFAEGATGPFFDFFLLLANPNPTDAQVSVTYDTSMSGSVTIPYTVAANSRQTISVQQEAPLLDNEAIAATVTSTNNVPILAERAIFWPAFPWYEGHASAGVTATGTRWALADGEAGGPVETQTYILIANTGSEAAAVRVTLLIENGTPVQQDFSIPPNSRFNVNTGDVFPQAVNQRFGALVESIGATPQPIVVERSMYTNAGGVVWAAGTNALATRLQ